MPTLIHYFNSTPASAEKYVKRSYKNYTENDFLLLGKPLTSSISGSNKNFVKTSDYTYNNLLQTTELRKFGRWVNRYQYWTDGNLKKITFNTTMPNGNYRYRTFNNYKRGKAQVLNVPTRNGSGQISAMRDIDNNGWTLSATDFMNQKINYGYDELGRLTKIDPVSSSLANTQIEYHVGAGVVQRMSQASLTTEISYDAMLRQVFERRIDENTGVTHTLCHDYDYRSNEVAKYSWKNGTSCRRMASIQYDNLDRKVAVIDERNSGAVSSTEYLPSQRIRHVDFKGNISVTSFRSGGLPEYEKPIKIISPENVTTSITYNLFDNILSISQGDFTEFRAYDDHQNLCFQFRPETSGTAYQYDPLGTLVKEVRGIEASSGCQTNAQGKAVNYYYNAWGMLTLAEWSDGVNVSQTYNNNGQIKSISREATRWDYNYDDVGQLAEERLSYNGTSYSLKYEYDNLGNRTSLAYPNGMSIQYSPNAFGWPTRVGKYASDIQYYADGGLKSLTYGNGLSLSMQRNARNLVQTIQVDGNSRVSDLHYYYDDNANILSIDDSIVPQANLSLSYDGLDRLIEANGLWGSGSITYDAVGNITSKAMGENQLNYDYGGRNLLNAVSGDVNRTFSYNGSGAVISNGQKVFTRADDNKVISVDGASYLYDGHGRRAVKSTDNQTEISLYSKDGTLLFQKNGLSTTSYIRLLGKPLAQVETRMPQ